MESEDFSAETGLNLMPLTGSVGAEIFDIDLAAPQRDSTWQAISRAFSRFGVVFFRDQELNSQQFLEFAGHFGTVTATPMAPALEDEVNVAELRRDPDQIHHVGAIWHTDQSARKHPVRATVLMSREAPAYGGDTCFINVANAFDALSEGMKKTLEGLRGVHSDAGSAARFAVTTGAAPESYDVRETTHPVVVRLPENGRRSLYINPGKVWRFEGWTEAESEGLLRYLYQHCQKPEFLCRFRWRTGSLAMWDNYQMWHYAVDDYFGQRRVMHRTMVVSEMFS